MTRARPADHWRRWRWMLRFHRAMFCFCVFVAVWNAVCGWPVGSVVALCSLLAETHVLTDLMPRWAASLRSWDRMDGELAREIGNLHAVTSEWLVPR